jgi:hypothetical protein
MDANNAIKSRGTRKVFQQTIYVHHAYHKHSKRYLTTVPFEVLLHSSSLQLLKIGIYRTRIKRPVSKDIYFEGKQINSIPECLLYFDSSEFLVWIICIKFIYEFFDEN